MFSRKFISETLRPEDDPYHGTELEKFAVTEGLPACFGKGAVQAPFVQLTDQTHLLTFFSSQINRDDKLQMVGFVTKDSA
jgi:hypothetical protein